MRHKLIDADRACFLTEIAEKVYGVDPLDTTRARTNVNARAAISIVLIGEEERYEAIGAFFKKDCTSIMHVVKKHPDLMQYDKEYRANYQRFLLEIGKPVNKVEYILSDIKGQIIGATKELKTLNYTTEEIQGFWKEILN